MTIFERTYTTFSRPPHFWSAYEISRVYIFVLKIGIPFNSLLQCCSAPNLLTQFHHHQLFLEHHWHWQIVLSMQLKMFVCHKGMRSAHVCWSSKFQVTWKAPKIPAIAIGSVTKPYPICSMYGRFSYIWHKFMVSMSCR